MNEEYLILVDEQDRECGRIEKLEAHRKGLLHRAFSIFIFNTSGELLLQQRAEGKYHSGGLWTNTCCSHPRFGENMQEAVRRRLLEEMGMQCETSFAFSFLYKADVGNNLVEHEYDHVYTGISDQLPVPRQSEAQNWKYMSMEKLQADLQHAPHRYTEWLKICMPQLLNFTENFSFGVQ